MRRVGQLVKQVQLLPVESVLVMRGKRLRAPGMQPGIAERAIALTPATVRPIVLRPRVRFAFPPPHPHLQL